MKLKTKIALKLAKELRLNLSSVQLDDITLEYMEEGNLREGYEVFVTDEEGAFILPEDGEYAYGEKTVVIESGIVISINENEKQELKKKRQKEKKRSRLRTTLGNTDQGNSKCRCGNVCKQ